ncbi:MAG: LCP family protein [Candidatus Dormibacteria bacterium]
MPEPRRRAGLRDGRGGRGKWGPSAPPAPGSPGPPRRRWSWILLGLLLVLLLPVGYVGYNLASTMLAIGNGNHGDAASRQLSADASTRGTVYMLLLGSDERHDKSGNVVPGQVPHSDTMILAAIDTDHHTMRMLSLPRDVLVTIPGQGSGHRINEAYTIGEVKHLAGGGPVLAVRTVEKLTGIKIPFYAVTTFDGFRQTVDAVGGVPVNNDRPITDHDYPGEGYDYMPVYVPAGLQLMNGERALEYVRSRHDDPLSDFGRNQRQQKFLKALSARILRPEQLGRFTTFLDIAKVNLRTNLSPAQMLSLGRSLASAGYQKIQTYAIGREDTREPNGAELAAFGAVEIPVADRVRAVVAAFERGDPNPDQPSPSPSGG